MAKNILLVFIPIFAAVDVVGKAAAETTQP